MKFIYILYDKYHYPIYKKNGMNGMLYIFILLASSEEEQLEIFDISRPHLLFG